MEDIDTSYDIIPSRDGVLDTPLWLTNDVKDLKVHSPVKPRSIKSSNTHFRRCQTARKTEEDVAMKVYLNFCRVTQDRGVPTSNEERIISSVQLLPRSIMRDNELENRQKSHVIDDLFALMKKKRIVKKEKRERLYSLVISRIKAVAAHPSVDNIKESLTLSGGIEEGKKSPDGGVESHKTENLAIMDLATLNAHHLKNDMEEVQRTLLVAIIGLKFCESAKNYFREKQKMNRISLKRICRVLRAYRKRRKLAAMTNMIWPIKFILAMKIARKNRAITIIRYSIDFCIKKKCSVAYIMRHFHVRIKLIQRTIRRYLQTRRCRKEAILLYWNKIEKCYRHVLEEREKRRLEAKRVLFAKRLASQKGHNNIHVKWHRLQSKVRMLQQQINIVTFDAAQMTHSNKNVADDMIVSNINLSRSEFKSYFSYNHRMEIIGTHLISKYKIHYARIKEKKQEIVSASTVDVKHAMLLLANPKNLSSEHKSIILEAQLAKSIDTERISKQIRDLHRAPIFYLTGSLGPSWKNIIEEVVQKHMRVISSI